MADLVCHDDELPGKGMPLEAGTQALHLLRIFDVPPEKDRPSASFVSFRFVLRRMQLDWMMSDGSGSFGRCG